MPSGYHALHTPHPCLTQDRSTPRNSRHREPCDALESSSLLSKETVEPLHSWPEEHKPLWPGCFSSVHALKSFLKSIVAFVLVGSIFFYFVDWFSEVERDKSGEVVQKTVTMVIKKMPTLVGNEHLSTLPDNGMEDQSAMLSKEKAVIGDTQPAFDPVETQEAVRNLASPTNDDKLADGAPGDDFQIDGTSYSETPAVENTDARTSPEEPDPASVIDYVLKKRGP
jgi:hypothetical protein